jgi:hypothetical protein
MPHRLSLHVVLALLAGATACGTTVPSERQGLPAQGLTAVGASPGAADLAAGDPAAPTGSGRDPSSVLGPGTTPSLSGGELAPGRQPTVVHQARALVIGFVYASGANELYGAAGLKNVALDDKAAYEALVADVNKRGGVFGQPVKTVFTSISATSSQPLSAQLQAACDFLTQDNKVDVVISTASHDPLKSCLTQRRVPLVGYGMFSQADYDANPGFVNVGMPTLERLVQATAVGLLDTGWASSRWDTGSPCTESLPTIGVLTYDLPAFRTAYDKALLPELRRRGLDVKQAVFVTYDRNGPPGAYNAGFTQAAQNAVLSFRSSCIDHVLFLFDAGAMPGRFMLVATQQRYTPRYGFETGDFAQADSENLPDKNGQLHGSLGVGWSPYTDVEASTFDATAAAPARACLKTLAAAGIKPSDSTSATAAVIDCDEVWLAVAAARAGGAPHMTAFLAGVAKVGTSFRPSGTFDSALGGGRRDLPGAYRVFAWDDMREAYAYRGGVFPLS